VYSLAVAFYSFALWLLARLNNLAEGIFAGILLCSPPVVMAVERGNVDLIVFVLVAAGLLLNRRWPASAVLYPFLLAAAMLKLFPAGAFIAILRERRWRAVVVTLLMAVSFGFYMWSILPDLQAIIRNTEYGRGHSFGAQILVRALLERIAPAWAGQATLLALAAVALLGAASTVAGWRTALNADPAQAWRLDAFRVGAGIFLLVFSLTSNWDYRLMFLLPTVPQTLHWIRGNTQWRRPAFVGLALLVFQMWASGWSSRLAGLDEAAGWALVVYYAASLGATLRPAPDRDTIAEALLSRN